MAPFPRIDQPCPLGIDEQRRIDGHCQRCDTRVHALDGMDLTERRALLAQADGPVCVSYRRSTRLAHAAAIAITLVAGSAFAGEDCNDAAAAPLLPAVQQSAVSPVSPLSAVPPAAEEEMTTIDWVVMGGISDPGAAEWVDDSSLPELPVIAADAEPAPVARRTDG